MSASSGEKRVFRRHTRRYKTRKNNPSFTSNFSEIETNPSGSEEIQKLASQAGRAAASEAKVIGIPKIFARGNKIIREFANGETEVVIVAEGLTEGLYFRKFKSGVLHARKK